METPVKTSERGACHGLNNLRVTFSPAQILPETKPIRGSRYSPSGASSTGTKKVRKSGTQNEECVPQNRTKNVPHKMPENPAMARVRTVRKGTKKGTQIAQIQVRKVRKTKRIQKRSFQEVKSDVARLTGSF
ncbi:hypothetical protein MOQ95_000825 [Salmonella enterica]|nr:hypothetical protein [Salmonella enterica]